LWYPHPRLGLQCEWNDAHTPGGISLTPDGVRQYSFEIQLLVALFCPLFDRRHMLKGRLPTLLVTLVHPPAGSSNTVLKESLPCYWWHCSSHLYHFKGNVVFPPPSNWFNQYSLEEKCAMLLVACARPYWVKRYSLKEQLPTQLIAFSHPLFGSTKTVLVGSRPCLWWHCSHFVFDKAVQFEGKLSTPLVARFPPSNGKDGSKGCPHFCCNSPYYFRVGGKASRW
jgi:hypothetical protein